jgi:hypothetical protein
MTGRERVIKTLNFEKTDRVPVDMGGTLCSGAHVSIVSKLRKAIGLGRPGDAVKVIEPYQMLGEVAADLREALGLDVVYLPGLKNFFGFANTDWKPWKTFDGTDVLVPGMFNTELEEDGSILQYPEGDRSVPASVRMPENCYYFNSIIRQEPIDDSKLDPADNLEEFSPISDEDLRFYEQQAEELYNNTDLEWYVSLVTRKEYIKDVFAGQTERVIQNLERIYQAVGNKVQLIFMDGADLATQNTLFCGPEGYRELYMPFSRKLNDWIHTNTKWKTLKHSCGGCEPLIEGFIEAGFDILNPIQTSAKGMDPQLLVDKYGGRIAFWGGGVDTQKTLPFGTPEEVRREVSERVRVFSGKGGFVFNTIHNIQGNTPIENLLAMFEALGRNVSA